MKHVYFDPKWPAAFAGPLKVFQVLKNKFKGVNFKEVKQWLQDQDSYSLSRDVKRKFPRSKIVTNGLDHLHDIDLADVSNLSEYNDNVKFLLVCIDTFSRYLWVVPLMNKYNTRVMLGLKLIFQQGRIPKKNKIRCRQGIYWK